MWLCLIGQRPGGHFHWKNPFSLLSGWDWLESLAIYHLFKNCNYVCHLQSQQFQKYRLILNPFLCLFFFLITSLIFHPIVNESEVYSAPRRNQNILEGEWWLQAHPRPKNITNATLKRCSTFLLIWAFVGRSDLVWIWFASINTHPVFI